MCCCKKFWMALFALIFLTIGTFLLVPQLWAMIENYVSLKTILGCFFIYFGIKKFFIMFFCKMDSCESSQMPK
jgi:hypothetical protein